MAVDLLKVETRGHTNKEAGQSRWDKHYPVILGQSRPYCQWQTQHEDSADKVHVIQENQAGVA
jgi:hypothetical protein